MSDDRAIQRVLSGETWTDFCEGLKAAGAVILRPARRAIRSIAPRASGISRGSRARRSSSSSSSRTRSAPVFRRPSHETVKIGADNPDNHYQSASISRRVRVP